MSHRKLVAELFSARREALQSFFRRRLRARRDAPDLTQEVYLRILRAGEGTIENPEIYLLTVANNLVKEHGLLTHRRESRETLTDPSELPDLPVDIDYADESYLEARKARLGRVVRQLDARYQLVLSLTYEQGLSQAEIAAKLNVSRRRRSCTWRSIWSRSSCGGRCKQRCLRSGSTARR